MKAKTYEKTNPKQERIVNIRNLSDKFSILSRKSGAKTSQNQIFGAPRLQNGSWRHRGSAKRESGTHKGSSGQPNRTHRDCLETPKAPQKLPGKALGPAWETPRGNFGANFDPKLDDFAANVFEALFVEV